MEMSGKILVVGGLHERRKKEVIDRIMAAERKFQCSGCSQKFTVLVSLNCNCGGQIEPIKKNTEIHWE